jgi:hypothetical protein
MSRTLLEQILETQQSIVADISVDYVLIRDEKATTTAGGTFTSGAWRTRDLNTEVSDGSDLAAVESNQVTLQPGIWVIHCRAPANEVWQHQARLRNITDTATVEVGGSASAFSQVSYAFVTAVVSISVATIFELQHQGTNTQFTNGFGLPADLDTEVYSVFEAWRIGDA